MSIFGGRDSKGASGNSGNASNGSWTFTSTSGGGKRKAKAIRKEWPKPRSAGHGSNTPRSSRRWPV